MEQICGMITQLIVSQMNSSELNLPLQPPYSDSLLIDIYNTAKAHDVVHLVGAALLENKLLDGCSIKGQYSDRFYAAVFRCEKLEHTLNELSAVLEQNSIAHIPLKGAVIRKLYPQPWMRTSCDIDVLVHEQDLVRASELLTEKLGYSIKKKGNHDLSLLTAENISVELHFNLTEQNKAVSAVLNDVWSYARPVSSDGNRYELSEEMFCFYHIAHMAKHFVQGGCGMRPFLDLWMMEQSSGCFTDKTQKLLKKGGLLTFADCARQLSRAWFGSQPHNHTTQLMQDFILKGGCFGSAETRMLSHQQLGGGKKKYILRRIFIPYNELKKQYPVLEKHRILFPLYELCRLFSLLTGRKKKLRKTYMRNLNGVTKEQAENINLLFERVGL